MDPKNFVGRAPKQVIEFVDDVINPIISEYKDSIGIKIDLNV
jgi:adenylosuccinate lyase